MCTSKRSSALGFPASILRTFLGLMASFKAVTVNYSEPTTFSHPLFLQPRLSYFIAYFVANKALLTKAGRLNACLVTSEPTEPG